MHQYLFASIITDTARDFGVNGSHLFAQCVSFAIVAFLLHRFAYRPILQVLEERRQRIAEALANAAKVREELAQAAAARDELLARANTQADQLIDEARAAAARVFEQETQKAVAAANQIVAKAHEASALELARMKAELRGEMVRLIAATTAKVTNDILTPEQRLRLDEETSRQLAA